ncbi:MAG: dUTP diphosphatase [Candidatus Kapaibacteriota bacterium]|jgi:dUTP pyrophosphatase
MTIPLQRLPHAGTLPVPSYATGGAAGMDVCAALDQPLTIAPSQIVLVPTGFCMAVPVGFECQVRSRSGLAAKHGIFALNAPGTIDSDYRGEVKVILANFSGDPFVIEPGMRIAQLVVAQHATVQWEEVSELGGTERGSGGFGSTGTNGGTP